MILEKNAYITPAWFMSKDIFEYDMKRGGLSIIKEKGLLPESKIKYLESLPKDKSTVEEGKLKRNNKELSKSQMDGFREYRLAFGEANELTDDDIVAVAKDAIFTTKYCSELNFGKYIVFREKNYYTSFLKVNEHKNIYLFKGDNGIDVKGISDEKLEYHKDYLLKELSILMRFLSQYDDRNYIKYLSKLMSRYKRRELPIEYYRSFDSESKYSVMMEGNEIFLNHVVDEQIKDINITYNYVYLLVPLISILTR